MALLMDHVSVSKNPLIFIHDHRNYDHSHNPQVVDSDHHDGGHGLCLQASFDEFPYYYHRSPLMVFATTPLLAMSGPFPLTQMK